MSRYSRLDVDLFLLSMCLAYALDPWDAELVERRIGLVGCVKKKLRAPARAQDLYTSPLFRGRRQFVEASCDEWWILSAKHGLVDPREELHPYDVTLNTMGVGERREWSQRVLEQIRAQIDPSISDVFEIHAGANYRVFGLVAGLSSMGFVVEVPTEGLRMGAQLQFYKHHS